MTFPLHYAKHIKLWKWKYLTLANFWVLKHEKDIKNWELALISKLCKGSHKNELLRSAQVQHSALRWHATAFPVTFSIPHDQLTLSYTDISLSIRGVVGVLWVLSSCVTCLAYALFMMRYTFISAFVSDHHHQSFMELGHLLTRSSLMHPEVSLTVCHDFFCQLGNIAS